MGEQKKEKVEVPKKFQSLIEEIEKLSVVDLAELVKILEEKFGVSAQASVVIPAVGSTNDNNNAPAEEKTVFSVELTSSGENKIGAIKTIREFVQIGLKEAKDLVDAAPKIVKENVPKDEAEKMKKALEAIGAVVTLK